MFGIGTGATAAQRVVDGPVESQGWPGLVGRFVALGAFVLWAGVGLVGDRASGAGLARRRLAALAVAAPALALAGTAVSLVSAAFIAGGSAASVLDAVGASQSSQFRVMAMVAAALGLATAGRAPWPTGGRPSPASAPRQPRGTPLRGRFPLAATSFAADLVAAGVWSFAIVAALLAANRARSVLVSLSPCAVGAAAIVVVTGAANAVFGLAQPSELTSTGYGRVVVAKTVLAAVMDGALLTSIPDPPRQAGAEVVTGADPVLAELASYDAARWPRRRGPTWSASPSTHPAPAKCSCASTSSAARSTRRRASAAAWCGVGTWGGNGVGASRDSVSRSRTGARARAAPIKARTQLCSRHRPHRTNGPRGSSG